MSFILDWSEILSIGEGNKGNDTKSVDPELCDPWWRWAFILKRISSLERPYKVLLRDLGSTGIWSDLYFI